MTDAASVLNTAAEPLSRQQFNKVIELEAMALLQEQAELNLRRTQFERWVQTVPSGPSPSAEILGEADASTGGVADTTPASWLYASLPKLPSWCHRCEWWHVGEYQVDHEPAPEDECWSCMWGAEAAARTLFALTSFVETYPQPPLFGDR